MNFEIKNHHEPVLDVSELATLGLGQMAYVKPLESDEVARLFPRLPSFSPACASSHSCPPAASPSC